MKPKPFASLNHFTVPVSIGVPFSNLDFLLRRVAAGEKR